MELKQFKGFILGPLLNVKMNKNLGLLCSTSNCNCLFQIRKPLVKRHISFYLWLVVLALSVISRQSLAQWSIDSTVNNAICTTATNQYYPKTTSDGAGGAIITWDDLRNGNYDIYAQRITASGLVQWTLDGLAISTATGDQRYPTIISDGTGGAIITWQDTRNGVSGYDIYAQRIDASGTTLWTTDGVAISTAPQEQNYPTIVTDGGGGAIITWLDRRNVTSYDIYAQRISAAGSIQWTSGGVQISTADRDQEDPSITSDGAGGAIITWQDRRSTEYDIYVQRIDASGVVQWTPNGVAISIASGHQWTPDIISDGAGGAIITWHDNVALHIYAQRISAGGVVEWTPGGVQISSVATARNTPVITNDVAGGAVIAWMDNRRGPQWESVDIYAQRVDANGVKQWWSDDVPISTATGAQAFLEIISDGAGGAVITWHDQWNGILYSDIYAQRISANGTVQWKTNGVAISAAAHYQAQPCITSAEPGGGAIIAWADYRSNTNFDVYAQRINADGTLGNPVSSISVLAPNGNEVWDAGSLRNITWSSINVSNLKIELSTNNGASWPTLLTGSTPAATGSFPWIVSNVRSQQCRIRITDVSNPSVYDISDAPFTISQAVVIVYPTLSLSPASATQGSSVTITGSGYTSNSPVRLRINGPASFPTISTLLTSGTSGNISYTFASSATTPAGAYASFAVDSLCNLSSNTRLFEITAPIQDFTLTVLKPVDGDIFYSGQPIRVQWCDKMQRASGYPIVGARRAYQYTLEFSSDAGSSWNSFATSSGYEPIGTVINFEAVGSTNPIGSNFLIRVVDNYKTSRIGLSEQFSVLPAISSNLQVDLVWDYSYPLFRIGNPSGVAADGVARVYLKLSKQNPSIGGQIENVDVSLSDNFGNEPRTVGKVMVARVTDSYSDEANLATSIQASDNNAQTEHWFWYVSPDDFVRNEALDGRRSSREVNATFTVTYEGGLQETIKKSIGIVRPPLLLVHGVGDNASTWKDFGWIASSGSKVLFKDDPRFNVRRVAVLDARSSFSSSCQNLLNPQAPSSFPRTILELKTKGYASNQVYYIGHSMGGNLLRTAVQLYPSSYYRNYSRGYVNRAITMDTPHNGTPLADLVVEFSAELKQHYYARSILTWMYGETPSFFGFNFIEPSGYSLFIYEFQPTGSVADLRVNGGFTHRQTDLPSHLVAGDIIPGEQTLWEVDPRIWQALGFAREYVDFVNVFFDVVLGSRSISNDLRNQLRPLRTLNKVEKAIKFLDYTLRAYVALGFVMESDAVVGVKSQLAGQDRGLSSKTIFDWHTHNTWTVLNPVTTSDDVGDRIYKLLNTLSTTSDFSGIPASPASIHPALALTNRSKIERNSTLATNTAELSLGEPSSGTEVFVDSTLHVKLLLSDTTNLSYVKLTFQNESYTDTSQSNMFTFKIQVNGTVIDSQMVHAAAFYEYPETTMVLTTSAMVYVSTHSPLLSVSASPSLQMLSIDQTVYPEYRATFETFISQIGNKSNRITASVADPSIVQFDPVFKGFKGLSQGETYAVISYAGLTDTIYFAVEGNASTAIREYSYRTQWNLVSLPLTVNNDSTTILFPTAVSQAFGYQGAYFVQARLQHGIGYWLKFPAAQTIPITGFLRDRDTIAIVQGWNLIGSITRPMAVARLTSNPPGVMTSQVFGYDGHYTTTDTIEPAKGYWIKVNQSGSLILSTGSLSQNPASRIRILPTSELPPLPPSEEPAASGLPQRFALEQTYPNPFNPSTTIKYALPVDTRVTIVIYNVLGQEITRLVDGNEEAGYHSVVWSPDNVSSGVYFYRIEATGLSNPNTAFTQVKKMLLIR